MPVIKSIIVDLPAPDLPEIAVIIFLLKIRLQLFSALYPLS